VLDDEGAAVAPPEREALRVAEPIGEDAAAEVARRRIAASRDAEHLAAE
jgi:hypothetical protein